MICCRIKIQKTIKINKIIQCQIKYNNRIIMNKQINYNINQNFKKIIQIINKMIRILMIGIVNQFKANLMKIVYPIKI